GPCAHGKPWAELLLRLRVVLLAVDAGALLVLLLLQAALLFLAHLAVCAGVRFGARIARLAGFELRRFARGQAARLQALLDALLLVRVALDGAGLREHGAAEGKPQRGGDSGVGEFHDDSLVERW